MNLEGVKKKHGNLKGRAKGERACRNAVVFFVPCGRERPQNTIG